jgi:MoaA/NifB/PqqE/SkfB family radical SAM enzyme
MPNNNCIFCLDGDRTDRYMRTQEEIIKEIDEGRREGATKLILSGGEPTIHPKLIDFIKYGRSKGYTKIQIVTNGRMLGYSSFTRSLKEAGLDETTFSIHGHTRKLHEGHTRVPGSFAQIVSGIKNALDNGFIVNTDTTITKLNYKYLPQIISFLHSFGVTEVNLMNIVPFGNAWKNRDAVLYDFDEVTPYIHRVVEYCEGNGMVLWLSRFPAEYLEGYEKYIESYKKIAEDVTAIGESHFRNPECKGERCRYCGVSGVCEDITKALNGKIKKQKKPSGILDFWDFFNNDKPRSITDALPEVIKRLERNRKFDLLGIPLCMMPSAFWERICHRIPVQGSKECFKKIVEYICKRDMVKPKSCEGCSMFYDCAGVYREYARKFGFGEMKKISCKEMRITLKCNQKCVFCNTDINSENVILDDDKIRKTIEKWKMEGVNYIIISGGEPTLHPGLEDFITQASRGCMRVDIQTNAVLLSDMKLVKRIKNAGLDSAFVSFHSHRKEKYKKLTCSDELEKCILGIKNLILSGISTSINVVVNELNYRDLPSIAAYIGRNFPEITSLSISYVCPVNEALKNRWAIPKISDAAPFIMKAIDVCENKGIKVRIAARCGIPSCLLPGYEKYFEAAQRRQAIERDKIKKEDCKECQRNDICDGFWKEYVKIHGFD